MWYSNLGTCLMRSPSSFVPAGIGRNQIEMGQIANAERGQQLPCGQFILQCSVLLL